LPVASRQLIGDDESVFPQYSQQLAVSWGLVMMGTFFIDTIGSRYLVVINRMFNFYKNSITADWQLLTAIFLLATV
jgi:hypothetical protein